MRFIPPAPTKIGLLPPAELSDEQAAKLWRPSLFRSRGSAASTGRPTPGTIHKPVIRVRAGCRQISSMPRSKHMASRQLRMANAPGNPNFSGCAMMASSMAASRRSLGPLVLEFLDCMTAVYGSSRYVRKILHRLQPQRCVQVASDLVDLR